MNYYEKSIHMKKYLKEVDKLWFERYHNFLTHIRDRKGFNPMLVAQNPNTNIIQLLRDPLLKDFKDVFVRNPNINCQILDSLESINWDFTQLYPQSYISIEFILKHIKTRKFNWFSLSSNKHFTMEDIKFHKDFPWDFKGVSRNPNLDWFHVQLFHNNKKELDWNAISQHRNISMEIIKGNSSFPWDVDGMSLNPNVSSSFIARNPGVKWNYMLLSENPAVRLRFIFKNLDKPWCWVKISSHPRLTIGIIQKYPNLGWNWYRISANPAFNLDIARHYIDFPWSYPGFSSNPNIRLDTIIKYIDYGWDFNEVCGNLFTREKNKFYEYHLRKYFMAKKIAIFWRKSKEEKKRAVELRMREEYYENPDENLPSKPPRPTSSKPPISARFLPLPPIPTREPNLPGMLNGITMKPIIPTREPNHSYRPPRPPKPATN